METKGLEPGGPHSFVCPECGGTKSAGGLRVMPAISDTSPWAREHARDVCAACRRVIPTPLAERWQGEALEEARDIWRRLFRDDPQSGPLPAEGLLRLFREFGRGEPNSA